MSPTGIADDFELLIQIDREVDKTLQRQLIEQLRRAILQGQLVPGRRLPSTRVLADALGISRNIAMIAYDELYAQGYLERRQGSGTYVSRELPALPRPGRPFIAEAPRWLPRAALPEKPDHTLYKSATLAFRLGVPDISSFPQSAWRLIWREVVSQLPPAHYGSPLGSNELRTAIAEFLGRSRGITCDKEDVIITSSAGQALDLIARTVLRSGGLVGFEEPGYSLARQILLAQRASIVPIPVDDDGMQVEALPVGSAAPVLVYVTPSHQFPLASRLSLARRMALLEWAGSNDSLIIEDDYDSEFRFDASPLPALASLDMHGRVAYIGTFSKILTPALRVGYLVAPRALRMLIAQFKILTDYHTSWPLQQALVALINDGYLERHIRRMCRLYAEKRALLSATLLPVAHLARLRGLEAGLHAYLELNVDLDAQVVAYETARRGVLVNTLDDYYMGRPDRNGLLLGYGGLSLREIARGTKILAEVIAHIGRNV